MSTPLTPPELAKLEQQFAKSDEQQQTSQVIEQGERLSAYFFAQKQLPRALDFASKVRQTAGEATPPSIFNRMGVISAAQGEHKQAVELFTRALAGYRQQGNRERCLSTSHNLGATALKIKDFETYFEYEMQAYKLALKLKKKRMVFMLGYSLGGFLLTTGKQKDGAVQMLKNSYRIGLASGYPETGKLEMFMREQGLL